MIKELIEPLTGPDPFQFWQRIFELFEMEFHKVARSPLPGRATMLSHEWAELAFGSTPNTNGRKPE
ncbi:MAG: hypothetical protein AMXMBFR75_29440 [Candidatus Hinthialibacteria bacterium]